MCFAPINKSSYANVAVCVYDEQSAFAACDGDVGGGDRGPPRADRIGVDGSVFQTVGYEFAQRRLAARGAGKDGPAGARIREGGVEEGVIAGGGYGWPSISAGVGRMSVIISILLGLIACELFRNIFRCYLFR